MSKFFLFVACPLLAACSSANAAETIAYDTSDLPSSAGIVGTSWQSSGFYSGESDDEWLRFPARATVTIPHALGRTPAIVAPYLAFDARGDGCAPAAGDLTRIVRVSGTTVTLRNDTNEDFFLRLAVQ
jgi:hypothetical protein